MQNIGHVIIKVCLNCQVSHQNVSPASIYHNNCLAKIPMSFIFCLRHNFFNLTNGSDTKFIALPMDMDYIRIKLVRNQYVQEDVRSSGENPNTNKKVRHERAQEGRYHLCDRGRPVVQQPWFVDCYEELKGKIFDYLDP